MRLQSYLEKQGEENSRRPFGGAGVRGSQFVVQLGVVQLYQELDFVKSCIYRIIVRGLLKNVTLPKDIGTM